MENQQEIWKDIKGYEGKYRISSFGNLASFSTKRKEWKIRSNKNRFGWYFTVCLGSKKPFTTKRIHRLVAEAFIPNPENKPEVNHKDGNKQNNRVENLEWCTRQENVNHALTNGLASYKEMNHYNQVVRPKEIFQYTLNGVFIAKYRNSQDASNATGVCQRNILQVANKTEYKKGFTRKQAGGYIWRFD